MHVNIRCHFKCLSIKNDRLRQSITTANLIDLSIRIYLMEYLFTDKKQCSNNNYYYNVLFKKKGKIYRSLYDEIVK